MRLKYIEQKKKPFLFETTYDLINNSSDSWSNRRPISPTYSKRVSFLWKNK